MVDKIDNEWKHDSIGEYGVKVFDGIYIALMKNNLLHINKYNEK